MAGGLTGAVSGRQPGSRARIICVLGRAPLSVAKRRAMMGAGSSFPIDLILFGMIAAFLVLRLRSILGRRTGFERQAPPYQPPASQPAAGPIIEGRAEAAAPTGNHPLPDAASPLGQTLARMRSADRNFDPNAFLEGAEKAFRII